jgi:hypothetical protein
MVTDEGFRYKRRKRVEEPQARRGPGTHRLQRCA